MIRRATIRVAGYALSSAVAAAFYIGWIMVAGGPGSFETRLIGALILFVFGGFLLALMLMALPWALLVWISSKAQSLTASYFACSGAVSMILLGCAASSASPKPLFVEDQTFWEGFLIALERQGACLALSGMIIGFGYWFLAEKRKNSSRHTTK
ncbi:hypothetical protein P8935_11380 [Telmatobacter sp. DSM 110680]|uniref:Uncharacterized protein n=1 Tax=Telmatobacter sp. DSM 110680 TaxID=3036704 RepID=A0AAU7DS75_9BACT